MAIRTLNPKEEKVKELFEKCGLESVDMQNCTLAASSSIYLVDGAVLYKIKNTDSYLLFGNPVNYSQILEKFKASANDPEKFKSMFQDKLNLDEKEQQEENVIDGEANNQVHEINEDETSKESKPATEIKEEVNSMDFTEEDVSLIMKESNISREAAIKALSDAKNDVIQALVNLNKK